MDSFDIPEPETQHLGLTKHPSPSSHRSLRASGPQDSPPRVRICKFQTMVMGKDEGDEGGACMSGFLQVFPSVSKC